MRKIIIMLLLAVANVTAQAQSLSDLLNALTSSSSTDNTTTIKLTDTSLLGQWSFSTLAVGLTEGSSLQNAFGKASISQVENLANSMCASNGISEGMFSIAISSNNFATVTFQNGAKANSSYTLDVNNNSLSVEISPINGIEIGTLVATVTMNSDSDVTLLVDGKRLMEIADQIPSITSNSQYPMIKGIVNSLDGIMLGFKLKKI